MDAIRQDLVFAWRMLRKDRAYALAVILTLAVCLGANTAIVTVVQIGPVPTAAVSRIAPADAFVRFVPWGGRRACRHLGAELL